MSDFDGWINQVAQWQGSPSSPPEPIQKGKIKFEEPSRGYLSFFEDPLAIQQAMGYKDRAHGLPYAILKSIPGRLGIVAGILQTRCNQLAAFAAPYRNTKSLGYVVKHKNSAKQVSKAEQKKILEIEQLIYNCGNAKPNPYAKKKRDDLETFIRKIVRDTLTYDAVAFEIVPDRQGIPYEWRAIDASTVRFAADAKSFMEETWTPRELPLAAKIHPNFPLGAQNGLLSEPATYRLLQLYREDPNYQPAYVQLLDGHIKAVYTEDELAYGVRNPRTDVYSKGYGYPEMEQLLNTLTSHLYAEEYNRRFFQNGSAPKGAWNFKSDVMTGEQLESFRRMWRSQMEGVENSWRTPIFQSEGGVEWIPLSQSNQEMEFGQWMEYLIKVSCSVFLIDPAELNFDLSGGVQQTPLFESSSEWKLKASRDRGLKPLLRFVAKMINDNIVAKIDDNFAFDFVGLDELTETEKHELRKEQQSSYLTLNEVRRAEDLPDLPYGDVPMNPTYTQAQQVALQQEQAKQQMQQQGEEGAPSMQPQGGGQPGGEEVPETAPQYSDTFTKAVPTEEKFTDEYLLEISLDEFITEGR